MDVLLGRQPGSLAGMSPVEQIVRKLVRVLRNACRPSYQQIIDEVKQLRFADAMVQEMALISRRLSNRFSESLVRIIEVEGLPDWWSLDLEGLDQDNDCRIIAICAHEFESSRRRLCSEISLLLLVASSTHNLAISPAIFSTIRTRLSAVSATLKCITCRYPSPMTADRENTVELKSSEISNDWKLQVNASISAGSAYKTAVVEKMICQITKDLQDRCDNVESPLREARMEVLTLKQSLNQRQEHLQSIQARCAELELAVEFNAEKLSNKVAFADELQSRCEDLQRRCVESELLVAAAEETINRDRLEHERLSSQIRNVTQRELKQMKELQQIRISELEDQVSAAIRREGSSKEENELLRGELKRNAEELESKHLAVLEQMHEQSKAELETLQRHVDSLNSTLVSREAESVQLAAQLKQSESGMEELRGMSLLEHAKLDVMKENLEDSKARITMLEETVLREQNQVQSLRQEKELVNGPLNQSRARVVELEKSEATWKENWISHQKALKQAKQAEESMLAILQKNSIGKLVSPIRTRQDQDTAATTPTPTTSLPEKSFIVSEPDDDDYSLLIQELNPP
jgi:hypothetical protein